MIRSVCLLLITINFAVATALVIYGATQTAQSPIEGILILILGVTLFATGYLFTKIIDNIK